MKTDNPSVNLFRPRYYGRQELALRYFPHMQPASAWRKLKGELLFNPQLRQLVTDTGLRRRPSRSFSPKEVLMIVEELGEP